MSEIIGCARSKLVDFRPIGREGREQWKETHSDQGRARRLKSSRILSALEVSVLQTAMSPSLVGLLDRQHQSLLPHSEENSRATQVGEPRKPKQAR